ncbi:uncharacterized protein [Choristoneura fumiferana]|uniref:uncharacterized protein n=1 Tax=Choristoneura fumiferana TaxID=7141 RepID=UPI003D15E7B8
MDTTNTAHSAVTDTTDTARSATMDTTATNTATANSVITTDSDRGDTLVSGPISACVSDPGPWKAAVVVMDLADMAQRRKVTADVDVKMALADMAQWRMDSDGDRSDISMEEDRGRDLVALDVEGRVEGRKKDAAAGKMIIRRTKEPKPLLLKE